MKQKFIKYKTNQQHNEPTVNFPRPNLISTVDMQMVLRPSVWNLLETDVKNIPPFCFLLFEHVA